VPQATQRELVIADQRAAASAASAGRKSAQAIGGAVMALGGGCGDGAIVIDQHFRWTVALSQSRRSKGDLSCPKQQRRVLRRGVVVWRTRPTSQFVFKAGGLGFEPTKIALELRCKYSDFKSLSKN
jgi:hypothetical protein